MARQRAGHLSTGIDAMDDEHWELMAVLGELAAVLGSQPTPSALVTLLERLRLMTADHFTAEEREMVAAGYPMTSSHAAQHRRFLDELGRLTEAVARGGVKVTPGTVKHLEFWFTRHIAMADRPMAQWLRAHRAPPAQHGCVHH